MKEFYFIVIGATKPVITLVRASNLNLAWKRYINR